MHATPSRSLLTPTPGCHHNRYLGEYDIAVAARAAAHSDGDDENEGGADDVLDTTTFHLAVDESFSVQEVARTLNRCVLPAVAQAVPLTVAVNVSCYAPFPEVDKMLFDLMVLGHLTPGASADVFAVPLGAVIRMFVEIPAPVDVVDELRPLASTPGDAGDKAGILSHLTMLRDAATSHRVENDSPFLASPSLERTLRCVMANQRSLSSYRPHL